MKRIIEIWQPRYKDNMCLVATTKIKKGENFIVFTKAKHLEGKTFRVMGEDVIGKCAVGSNGKISVYEIPMSRLELVEEDAEEAFMQ